MFTFSVYWSCQFIAHASNVSLRLWQQMGGVSVVEDILIDKSIHKSINSRSAVLKVWLPFFLCVCVSASLIVVILWMKRTVTISPSYMGSCHGFKYRPIGYISGFWTFATVLSIGQYDTYWDFGLSIPIFTSILIDTV